MKIQKPYKGIFHNQWFFDCAACGKPVSTTSSWFDKYVKGVRQLKKYAGAQVHKKCLSEKRKAEVQIEEEKIKKGEI